MSSTRTSVKARTSLPPPQATSSSQTLSQTPINRRRHSSLDQSLRAADYTGKPLSDVINTVDDARSSSPSTTSLLGRRRRKDANGGSRRSSNSSQDRNNYPNALGLSTVKETSGSNLMLLGEGFLAPTIASENRRKATIGESSPRLTPTNGLASPISPGGRTTGKVIENLTTELNLTKGALDDARSQLRIGHSSISSLQRSLDETKESLGRSRAENERLGQMMARKERQCHEALERARKAEVESKELGKSSREWGARVRKIEAELGEERISKQRAEVQYEAISTIWKQTREAWEKEMIELRESQGDAVRRNREEIKNILSKSKAAEENWKGREEEGQLLKGVIQELEMERNRAVIFVQGPVRELMAQLKEHEAHTKGQDSALEAVQDELDRILRLMRDDNPDLK